MKKDTLICFRASKDLHESLSRVARQDRRSLSSVIEIILGNYLKERNPSQGVENRKYPRKVLSLPAVISQRGAQQMVMGAITEISLGGARVLVPRDFKRQILINPRGSRFDIVFNWPAENKPIRLSCESSRVVGAEDNIHVGAFFVDADFESYRALQTYLT